MAARGGWEPSRQRPSRGQRLTLATGLQRLPQVNSESECRTRAVCFCSCAFLLQEYVVSEAQTLIPAGQALSGFPEFTADARKGALCTDFQLEKSAWQVQL